MRNEKCKCADCQNISKLFEHIRSLFIPHPSSLIPHSLIQSFNPYLINSHISRVLNFCHHE